MSAPRQYGREIRFTLSGEAVPKERARARIVTPKGRKPFIQHYTPAETVKFEKRVKALAAKHWHGEPSLRPIELQITVHTEIPDSWPAWKREAASKQQIVPTAKPDLDNVVKAISDALNGVCYRDDAQIFSIDPLRIYAEAGCTGYIEVCVRENWRCSGSITRKDELVLLA